ncbi:unnamed protein product [Phytophthora lilii]|uniref:Cilia- and flagella-associated protein 206 n=1 Tax=Phytophthora lilii TaxID=2077276 RepID=A0A9W6TF19_9STRA|nr:unnamed protein product [Phytophthora lilii]
MRRHFLFAEDEKERSVGDGKANLLRLWHNRREAMMEGDESANGGETNTMVARELTLLWDLSKPMNSCTLNRDGYVAFFARSAKALVLPLSTDAVAIAAAQRDWEYDLEGVGSIADSTKAAPSLNGEVMLPEQFREAVMQLAEILLPVESPVTTYLSFLRELRNAIAEIDISPPSSVPEQDESSASDPVDRFKLRPLNHIPKIANESFLQKLPPSSNALRSIRGLQPPDQRAMSLKQLLLSYNPRKFSLTRAFPKKKANANANDNTINVGDDVNPDATDVPQTIAVDNITAAKRLHVELVGSIGSGATPIRGEKLYREATAHWDPEDALASALTELPALRLAVVGPPGCGKTRLAVVLARQLGLKYLSLDGAVQRAVSYRLQLRRHRTPVVTLQEEDSTAEQSPATEAVEDAQVETGNVDKDDELEQIFNDEDLDAICAGGVVVREKAILLLRLEATRSLLAGVGVVMDDVYPCELSVSDELEHKVAVDYLVVLTALPSELEYQLGGSQLAPSTGRLYSVRELATLEAASTEELAKDGFSDLLLPPKQAEVVVDETLDLNTAVGIGDVNPNSEGQETNEPSPEENKQEGDEDAGQPLPEALVPPPEPIPAELSEIEPPGEPTLPFGPLALAKLLKGYREYVTRMGSEQTTQEVARAAGKNSGYHLIVVLAIQSLNVIRDQCLQTSLGLSRFSTSRQACPVALPEDLNDASRAEKVRWLLYGDWNTLLEAEVKSTTELFTRIPRHDLKRRLLSKWREFCPVKSHLDNALAPGDPSFAACYSGRVYMFSSKEALQAFCASPLQFLRREIPVSSKFRKLWLVTTGTSEAFTPSHQEMLETGLHVQTVSASKLLKISSSISMEMRLMSGQVVSPVEAAAAVADAAKALMMKQNASSGWMIRDLPLTRDVAAVLLEHGCVPDAILLMDRAGAIAQEEDSSNSDSVNALSALRNQQFQAEKAGADDISQGLGLAPRVIVCPLFCQPSDTLAAIERELNPIAPRLDSVEEGSAPELVDEYDPTVIFASPLPENDDYCERKLLSQLQESESDSEAPDPEVEIQAKATRARALRLQGECGRFCPVTWRMRGNLVPGLPSNVRCFQQKLYAFAGEKELRAFERNPAAFIPKGPRATASFVPCVLLLGVRGSGRSRIAAALAQPEMQSTEFPTKYINVDLATVASSAGRSRLLDEIKSEEARLSSEELFVRALQLELQQSQPMPQQAVAHIIIGLGPEASRIPTAATLEVCYKFGLFPSLVIPLDVSEDDAVNTLLNRWGTKLPASRRKLALTRKKEAADGEAEDDVNASDEGQEEEEEVPINLEAATEEESVRLREQFAEDQKMLDEAITGLRSRGVYISNPVDASCAPRQAIKNVRNLLDNFMAGRESFFERCEVLDVAMDGKFWQLLASGELLVGKHGFACPVTGRTDSLSSASVKAVVYRNQLYFPRSHEAQRAFMACPSRYVDKASCPPRHQLTCCVVGAPLSGKTRVAQELAKDLGLVYVSPQSAIDWVMQCHGGSALWSRLLEITDQQQSPLDNYDLIHAVICARLRSSECQARGWALDGYLLQHHELQRSLLASTENTSGSIQPDMVFVLERGFSSVWQEHHVHAEKTELRALFSRWHQYRLELLDVWTRRFGTFHIRQLDSSSNSLWHVAAQAQSFLQEQEYRASYYTRAMASDKAARSLGIVRSHNEVRARQHPVFRTFCPVELRAGRFYYSRQSNRELCADFRGCNFWFRNELNLEQFLASPEAYVGSLPEQASVQQGEEPWPTQEDAESEAQTLVDRAPVNASLLSLLTVPDCDFPEMKGYCPVTFASGSGAKDWSSLRHGSVFFRASYRSKVYFFVSEEARRKFCTEPSRYTSQSLPVKLPPQVTLAKSYPGQLEQQLGAALNEVLLALGSERPKFPLISIRASACVYLALSLKALQRRYQLKLKPDPRSARDEDEPDEEQKQRQEHREEQAERDAIAKLDAFVRDCRLGEELKAASTPTHPSCGSGVKVARSMRAACDSLAETQQSEEGTRTSTEATESLRRRFDSIVSGNVDKALPTDSHAARLHARAAFLEYMNSSS